MKSKLPNRPNPTNPKSQVLPTAGLYKRDFGYFGYGVWIISKNRKLKLILQCLENQTSFSLHNCHQETIRLKNKCRSCKNSVLGGSVAAGGLLYSIVGPIFVGTVLSKYRGIWLVLQCSKNQISFSLHNCHQETICLKNKWSWQIGLSRHKNKNWRFFLSLIVVHIWTIRKQVSGHLVIFSPHVNKTFQMLMSILKEMLMRAFIKLILIVNIPKN